MDLMRELGAMAFASRLRRLGDRLKAEATKLYRAEGIEFNDSWFLLALALSKRDGISVSEVAEAFGISHAAISQMASSMSLSGLIKVRTDDRDRRRTLLYLTEKGRSDVKALQPIWTTVAECTEEMIAATGNDMLAGIIGIEEQLDKKDLFTRVTERLNDADR